MMLIHLPVVHLLRVIYLALGAHKSTHVFHDPEYRKVDLTAKAYLLSHILQRYLLYSACQCTVHIHRERHIIFIALSTYYRDGHPQIT